MRSSAAVAQLDRVLGYEPRGRGFDSCQPHQISIFSRLEHSLEAYPSRLFFFVAFNDSRLHFDAAQLQC